MRRSSFAPGASAPGPEKASRGPRVRLPPGGPGCLGPAPGARLGRRLSLPGGCCRSGSRFLFRKAPGWWPRDTISPRLLVAQATTRFRVAPVKGELGRIISFLQPKALAGVKKPDDRPPGAGFGPPGVGFGPPKAGRDAPLFSGTGPAAAGAESPAAGPRQATDGCPGRR